MNWKPISLEIGILVLKNLPKYKMHDCTWLKFESTRACNRIQVLSRDRIFPMKNITQIFNFDSDVIWIDSTRNRKDSKQSSLIGVNQQSFPPIVPWKFWKLGGSLSGSKKVSFSNLVGLAAEPTGWTLLVPINDAKDESWTAEERIIWLTSKPALVKYSLSRETNKMLAKIKIKNRNINVLTMLSRL